MSKGKKQKKSSVKKTEKNETSLKGNVSVLDNIRKIISDIERWRREIDEKEAEFYKIAHFLEHQHQPLDAKVAEEFRKFCVELGNKVTNISLSHMEQKLIKENIAPPPYVFFR